MVNLTVGNECPRQAPGQIRDQVGNILPAARVRVLRSLERTIAGGESNGEQSS